MKTLFMNICIYALFAFSPLFSADATLSYTKAKMLGDLEFVKNTFDVLYAPYEWKKSYSGWELKVEMEKARQAILAHPNPDTKYFHRLINQFVRSTKDYHCAVGYFSTEEAYLPFQIKGQNGKYYFICVDRSELPKDIYSFALGDELVSFNGEPTDVVVQRLKREECYASNPDTDQSFAERVLTEREGYLGHQIPQGPVSIAVRSRGTNQIFTYQLDWKYHPEWIHNPLDRVGFTKQASVGSLPGHESSTRRDLRPPARNCMTPLFSSSPARKMRLEKEPGHLGSRKSLLPKLGTILWESSSDHFFHAYLFETDDKKTVGYIRVPVYDGDEEETEEFGEIINFFQKYADALVFDQLDNPGGNMFYMYALASVLTDRPLQTPQHRMAITQEDVMFALMTLPFWESIKSDEEAVHLLGDSLYGYPMSYQVVQYLVEHYLFVIDEWNAGHVLTNPYHLEGFDYIFPHPSYRFTKPILVLVNESCFSCGDFMPAILQDNRRATIFGKRTAGAGGYVLTVEFPNRWGIALFGVTGSIAERIDKQPIENLGVAPDVVYTVTEDDLAYHYRGYASALRQTLADILA